MHKVCRIKYLQRTSGHRSTSTGYDFSSTPKWAKKCIPTALYPESPSVIDDHTDNAGVNQAAHCHLNYLQNECHKGKPNSEIKRKLMDRTFNIRRHSIMHNPTSVQQLITLYPPLQEYDEVSINCIINKLCIITDKKKLDCIFGKDISAAMVTIRDSITKNATFHRWLIFWRYIIHTYMYTYLKLLPSLLLETKFFIAFVCLYYLLPDTRSCQIILKYCHFFGKLLFSRCNYHIHYLHRK